MMITTHYVAWLLLFFVCWTMDVTFSPAKTADHGAIDVDSGGPRNHVLDRGTYPPGKGEVLGTYLGMPVGDILS